MTQPPGSGYDAEIHQEPLKTCYIHLQNPLYHPCTESTQWTHDTTLYSSMQCNVPGGSCGGLRLCLTVSGSSRVRCIAFDCYAAAGQRLAGSTLRMHRTDRHKCIGGHAAPPAAAAPSRAAVVLHPSTVCPCMHALTNLRQHAFPAEARRCLPLQSGA